MTASRWSLLVGALSGVGLTAGADAAELLGGHLCNAGGIFGT
ncbi:hypothetical protein [Nonomuraea cypriaca]|nr:hypothetical protein [Nonomuraea cypriaca]